MRGLWFKPQCQVVSSRDHWSVEAYLYVDDLKLCFPHEDEVYNGGNRSRRREVAANNKLRLASDTPETRQINRNFVYEVTMRALIEFKGEEFVQNHPFTFDDLAFVFDSCTDGNEHPRGPRYHDRVLT